MIIGNGVDIIEVSRIKNAISRYGNSFLQRIFTDKEIKNAQKYDSIYQHLAGRFAVKEAVFKALGSAKLGFKDLEVINDAVGRPYCSLLKNNNSQYDIHISISHIKNYAVASAIITEKARGTQG